VARQHAHLLTSIWADPEFIGATSGAQRAYMLLLSQPKLTTIGLLVYLPSRWARLAPDTTLASVEGDIDELEASRFVVVDRDTDELLIRTLVRHESTASKVANPRWLTGLWNAWSSIESRLLRAEAVENVPASVWDSTKVQPPAEAVQMRRSAQKLLPETSARTNGQNVPQLPVTSSFETKQLLSLQGDEPRSAAAVEKSILDQAIDQLTDRELQRNPTRNGNPERHRAAVIAGKRRDHASKAHHWLALNPELDARALADLLEPPARPSARSAEPSRLTADGAPFIPGIGEARGLPDDDEPAWQKPDLSAARAALGQPVTTGGTPRSQP
jgi:hypothetical protein